MMTPEQLNQYDNIILAFSGGKDSTACFLWLLEQGVDASDIELWHHEVDGRESGKFMDWDVTSGYCQAFADAFGSPLFFSWKMGGFLGEMLRENQRTAPSKFETPEGIRQAGGTRGKKSTRRKFPQVSADLRVRWCSAYLKIDVAEKAINNQDRFNQSKTLFITGERGEESPGRSKYASLEPHRSDRRDSKKLKRHVDHFRPILDWKEQSVWDIIERWKVNVHPAYHMGWGRVSCATCIFGSCDQWSSVREIMPERFQLISDLEKEFDSTIQRKKSVDEMADAGTPFDGLINQAMIDQALKEDFTQPVILEEWTLPPGAFGDSCGSP